MAEGLLPLKLICKTLGAWHSNSIESPCWSSAPRVTRHVAKHVLIRCRLMRSFGSWALPFALNAFIIVFYFVAGELHGMLERARVCLAKHTCVSLGG